MRCTCQLPRTGLHVSRVRGRVTSRNHAIQPHQSHHCCHSNDTASIAPALARRDVLHLVGTSVAIALFTADSAPAVQLPPGTRLHYDKLDGYYFLYPEAWSPNTTTGNDVFYRNPFIVEENLFVDVSSPSSSKYSSVEDLGTPGEAANKLLDQYLNKEFMSTRLGIKREGEVVSATSRVAPDGKAYYDVDIRLRSYGSTNPYSITQREMLDSYSLEWDRHLLTTLGVANKRLYELRIQTSSEQVDADRSRFDTIQKSFRCKEVEA